MNVNGCISIASFDYKRVLEGCESGQNHPKSKHLTVLDLFIGAHFVEVQCGSNKPFPDITIFTGGVHVSTCIYIYI